jgi:3-oxoadipate enol-lactonase
MPLPCPWTTVRIGPAPFLAVDHLGAGPLLVFLHGIGGNRRNWHPNLPAFSARFHAAAWDARGYGDSDDGPLDIPSWSDDLRRLLDHFEAPGAHLVGLSMGGLIAMDFARRWPARILSLTLCDTLPDLGHLPEETRRDFLARRREPLLRGAEPRDIAPDVARSLVGPDAPPEVLGALVDSIARLRKASYLQAIDAVVSAKAAGDLGALRVPTLLVVGEADRLTTPALMQAMAARIPGARLALVPGAGHLPNLESPAAFADVVFDFLAHLA